MIFQDRNDAGMQLAKKLGPIDRDNAIVIGIARGGAIIAREVAGALSLPCNLLVTRKIGAPINPEFAIGAITENGIGYFDQTLIRQLQVQEEYLKESITKERFGAEKQAAAYEKVLSKADLEGKTVLLVDDGIATGASVKAALRSLKAQNSKSITLAIPVAPFDVLVQLKEEVDSLVCLHTPDPFYSVAQFYFNYPKVDEEEVVQALESHQNA